MHKAERRSTLLCPLPEIMICKEGADVSQQELKLIPMDSQSARHSMEVRPGLRQPCQICGQSTFKHGQHLVRPGTSLLHALQDPHGGMGGLMGLVNSPMMQQMLASPAMQQMAQSPAMRQMADQLSPESLEPPEGSEAQAPRGTPQGGPGAARGPPGGAGGLMGMLGQMVQSPAMQQMMGQLVEGSGGSLGGSEGFLGASRGPQGGQVQAGGGARGDPLGGMDLGQVMQQMMPMVSQVRTQSAQ